MPVATCRTCGATTNSATSNYFIDSDDPQKEVGVVTKCYARYDENKKGWVKGCCYDSATPQKKKMVDKLIEGNQDVAS